MERRLVVATAQVSVTSDIRQNSVEIQNLMKAAAASKARVVHFPEAALSGCIKTHISAWSDLDWVAHDEELANIATNAAKLGVWVVIGSSHRLAEPFWPQNSLYVLSEMGVLVERYSKRFCSNTEVTSWYTPGTSPVTFKVDGIRFGCAICIEVCFPEIFAEYERLDVDCVLLSSYSEDPIHGLMARAHAATNCFWVSLAVPAQSSSGLSSMMVGPDGNVMGEGTHQGLLLTTIDLDVPQFEIALRRARPWRKRARFGSIYEHRQA
jgi:predicted amidohydrolase